MPDEIRITTLENGATIMVNVTAIDNFIRQKSIEGAEDILKNGLASYLERNEFMEKKRKSKIQKWDEVGGAVETEIDETVQNPTEEIGAGPSISRNPMRGIEDMVEQNDNSFDGVINNLPEPKPAAQVTAEDVIEEEQKKKSIIGKIREAIPDPDKVRPAPLCQDELVRS